MQACRKDTIYNVSVVDESYRLVNAPTVIDLPDL